MEKIGSTLRFIIPQLIILISSAAVCVQSHHHDCHGSIRVAIVETHDCHTNHANHSDHHHHTCDGGCILAMTSAIIQSNDFSSEAQSLIIDDFLAVLAEATNLFRLFWHESRPIVSLFTILAERSGYFSATGLRGPPAC